MVGGKVDGQILSGTRSEKPKILSGTRDEKRKNLFGTKWQFGKFLPGSQRVNLLDLIQAVNSSVHAVIALASVITSSGLQLNNIIRTLHADIEKPTTLEKTFNNLHKINFYVLMKIN